MKSFPEFIRFKKPWRSYQKHVLDQVEESLEDNRLHIIAPPGSGKTIIGLEIARFLNNPTLILAPTLTIKEQWVERFLTQFFPEQEKVIPEWISTDIRRPGFLTVSTYQALHAIYSGQNQEEDQDIIKDDEDESKAEKKSDLKGAPSFESWEKFIALLEGIRIKTLILDEAHHLRSEWWVTLEKLENALNQPTIVALTATPPYDVPDHEWARYGQLCGPIDYEVSIPELVVSGDLCPHQDLLYLTPPASTENQFIKEYKQNLNSFLAHLYKKQEFLKALEEHPFIKDPQSHTEQILDDPAYVASILIFIRYASGRIPNSVLQILGLPGMKIPEPDLEWLETLLTGCLYKDSKSFQDKQALMELIKHDLHRLGAIERRQVMLRNPEVIKKLLIPSINKLNGIVEIVKLEHSALYEQLRMVILTDYIRKADFPKGPNDNPPIQKIGVITIFEKIRREGIAGIKVGILSGSLVVIPIEAQRNIQKLLNEIPGVIESMTPLLHDPEYCEIKFASQNNQKSVQVITELFNQGAINVLIGTRSLLGEGWDAPAINSLVIASFVGSYMLSNQMRGRAIRTLPGDPQKTANIWHLVCIELDQKYPSYDFEVMKRRFQSFVGVSFAENVISSGFDRMNIGDPPFAETQIGAINQRMAQHAKNRNGLREQWTKALFDRTGTKRMVETINSPASCLPRIKVFQNTIKALCYQGITLGGYWFLQLLRSSLRGLRGQDFSLEKALYYLGVIFLISAIVALPKLFKALWLFMKHGTLESSMRQVGTVLLESLIYNKIIKKQEQLVVRAKLNQDGSVACFLEGGSRNEQRIFLESLQEIMDPIENPRYILIRKSFLLGRLEQTDYHAVPQMLAKKNTFVYYFHDQWKKLVGPATLVYTRNPEGRIILLKARMESFSAGFQKCSERISCWK